MSDATARCLDLLGHLQTYRFWTGSELARRLDVTDRTLRRDIERLRTLGYEIEASRGVGGGYRLAAGTRIPPLLLTDDEVVAIAVGLRGAATRGLADSGQITVSALAKLEQVLPDRLRRRVAALQDVRITTRSEGPEVSAELVAQLALLCRESERIRFSYSSAAGERTRRVVDAHSLATAGRRWYLIAWDNVREDWRTFRLDRISALAPTGRRVPRRQLPAADAAEMIRVHSASGPRPLTGTVVIRVPWQAFQEHFGPWGRFAQPAGGETVRWPIGGTSVQELASALLWIPTGWDYHVEGPRELLDFLSATGSSFARVGRRIDQATAGADPSTSGDVLGGQPVAAEKRSAT